MSIRRFGLIALAAAALVAVMPSAALAKSKDRNHDKIPDRWEKKHHLSLHVKQTKRDQDKDGVRNLTEYRKGTNPRRKDTDKDHLRDRAELKSHNDPTDPDTDDDGVLDGDENAGQILSFDGTTLTISLGAGGSTISGLVVPGFTEVECDDRSSGESRDDDDTSGHGSSGSESSDDDEAEGDNNEGDQEDGDHNDGNHEEDADHGEDCGIAALVEGAVVHEAELELKNGTAVFEEIELLAAP